MTVARTYLSYLEYNTVMTLHCLKCIIRHCMMSRTRNGCPHESLFMFLLFADILLFVHLQIRPNFKHEHWRVTSELTSSVNKIILKILPLILPVFFKAGAAEISAAISESAGKRISGSLIAVSLCITCSANQPFLLWVTNIHICIYLHICKSMQKRIKIAQTKFSQAFGWFLFQLVVELSPHLPGLRSHWYRRRNAAPGAQTRIFGCVVLKRFHPTFQKCLQSGFVLPLSNVSWMECVVNIDQWIHWLLGGLTTIGQCLSIDFYIACFFQARDAQRLPWGKGRLPHDS